MDQRRRHCHGCGDMFTVGDRERNKRKWCSEACRMRTNRTRYSRKPRPQPEQRQPVIVKKRPCDHCGALFEVTRSDRVYCADRTCRARRTAAGAKQRDPDYQRKANAKYRGTTLRERVTEFICAWCGQARTPGVDCAPHASKFCGSGCKGLWHSRGGMSKADCTAAKRSEKAGQLGVDRSVGVVFVAGWCRLCGRPYARRIEHADSPYCSSECKRRGKPGKTASDRRRRERERGFKLTARRRREVYERDDFVCHLCGEAVDMEAHYLMPWAPTVDHVIPLARGGSHDMDNLRCAHRWCNSVRGDRLLTEAF